MKKYLALALALLMALTLASPALAAGYGNNDRRPSFVDNPVVEPTVDGNGADSAISGTISGNVGNATPATGVTNSAAGTNDSNMIVASTAPISPDAFRKLASNGLSYTVDVTADAGDGTGTGAAIAKYSVTAEQAARMRKTVRLTTKALDSETVQAIQRQLGDAYIISAFYSTQLFGNVLVKAYVNIQLRLNDSLKDMYASGSQPVVYKVNENNGKLTKTPITATVTADGDYVSFDIQKGDSYVVSALEAVGDHEVVTDAETTAETTAAETAAETTAAETTSAVTTAAVTTAAEEGTDPIDSGSEATIKTMRDAVSNYLSTQGDTKMNLTCGFSYAMTEDWLKETMLDEFGLDTDEYKIDFIRIWYNYPDYDKEGGWDEFKTAYGGMGDGIPAAGWFEFTITASDGSVAAFVGGENGSQDSDKLNTGGHIWIAVNKDITGVVTQAFADDIIAAGITGWSGKNTKGADAAFAINMTSAQVNADPTAAGDEFLKEITANATWTNLRDILDKFDESNGITEDFDKDFMPEITVDSTNYVSDEALYVTFTVELHADPIEITLYVALDTNG